MTFQTKIISPSGTALEAASVNFRFTILDSAGTCILYVEDYANVNMTGSQGIVAIPLGSGTKAYPPAAVSLYEVFNNATASFNCQAGGTSSPAATDNRQVVMQFNDGGGWQTLPQMAINAVPFANYATRAESLGAYVAADYLRPATLPTCTAGQALNWDGSAFTCITPAGGGGGAYTGVTSIANASGDITLAPAAGTGAVLVTSNTPSTSTSTGAIVITGGVGVSGAINTGGNITTLGSISSAGSMLAVTSIFTPQLYGTSTPSGSIRIDGTSDATKGNVLLASQGGSVGIGITTTPAGPLEIQTSVTSNALVIDGHTSTNQYIAVDNSGAEAVTGNISARVGFLDAVGTHGSHIVFETNRTGGAGTTTAEAMRITRSGEVGIGTNNPQAPLEVITTTNSPGVLVHRNSSTAGVYSSLGFRNSTAAGGATAEIRVLRTDIPSSGDNAMIFVNNKASGVTESMRIDSYGNVGIGTSTPTYALSVSGDVNVTGNFRVNGTILSGGGGPTLTDITTISNASGDITLAPAVGTGAVQINSGSASTSPTTGALIVSGGIGVSGGVYTGGAISSGSTVSATTSMYTPQLYGTSTASGDIRVDGTSDATKGNVLLSSAGGNVGIGVTTTPSTRLTVRGDGTTTSEFYNGRTYFHNSNSTQTLNLNSTTVVDVFATGSTPNILRWGPIYTGSGSISGKLGYDGGTSTVKITADNADLALFTGPTERIRILASNGYMGVGTSTPSSPMHVYTTTTAAAWNETSGLKVTTGGGGLGYAFSVNDDNFRVGNNGLSHFGAGGGDWGLLSLHTSSGSNAIGLALVNHSNGANSNVSMTFNSNDTGWSGVQVAEIGAVKTQNTAGNVNSDLVFSTTLASTPLEKMRLTSGGRFGIGTTSPAATLHVAGSTYPIMRVESGASWGALFELIATDISTYTYSLKTTGPGAPEGGNKLVIGGGGVGPMMTLTPNGIGIGTTSPTYALSVSGDVNVTGSFRVNGTTMTGVTPSLSGITNISNASGDVTLAPAVGTGAVQISSGTASTSPTTGALIVSGGIGASGAIYTGGAISSGSTVSAVTSVLTPQLYGTSTPSGNILIDGTSHATKGNVILSSAGGKVGIGTTTPAYQLSVVGSGGATIGYFSDGTQSCAITPSAAGSVSCSSDERLKKNIQSVSDELALENILKLQTVTYEWRSVDNGRHTGYIAQDVEKVAPEFVLTGKDGYKQVSYVGFIPWITGSIKALYLQLTHHDEQLSEQKRQIANLESQNADLKKENEEIKKRLESLEKHLLGH